MHIRLIFILLAAGLLGDQLAMAQSADARWEFIPSLTVHGTGEIQSEPDMAEVQVGVVTEANTASAALHDNNQAMNALFQTLKNGGIEEKDQQTTSFRIAPQYRHRKNEPPQIVGYQVINEVQVKVRELSKLGGLLDEVVASGANHIRGIQFSVSDPTPLLDQARRKAMADAQRKAELYAQEAKVSLGAPIRIQEQSTDLPEPIPAAGMDFQYAERAAVPIARGQGTIRATVVITFRLPGVQAATGQESQ